MYCCYSLRFGWKPLLFWLEGRNFYKERKQWIIENEILDSHLLTHLK